MALSLCLACSTAYAAGLARCPQCQSPDFVEQGQPMPKITRKGGPSTELEEVPSSPGSNSSPSPEKPLTSETPSETDRPRPARTTASHSSKARKDSSTAGSTATSGPADN